MATAVAGAAIITLKHDDAIALPETGSRVDIVDDAGPFVPEVLGIVVKLEVVFGPDTAAFQADRCYLGADDGIAGEKPGIGSFHELDAPGFRYREDNVTLCHVRVLPVAIIKTNDYRERRPDG
jgi:hypothetical protein